MKKGSNKQQSKAKNIILIIMFLIISLYFGDTQFKDIFNEQDVISQNIYIDQDYNENTDSENVNKTTSKGNTTVNNKIDNSIEENVNSNNLDIYVFDVGQADSILVSCNGKYMLIDAGNNADGKLIVKELQDMGIVCYN